ncbi:MAG: antibiotic biosynthesis monooxygenase family protein [Gemmatimonadales bacterium]
MIVWEFEPKAGQEREFERTYGADGDWAALFRRSPEFQGTELLRPLTGRRYLTIDRWRTFEAFVAFRDQWQADYESLDRRCESLTEREVMVGRFDSSAD